MMRLLACALAVALGLYCANARADDAPPPGLTAEPPASLPMRAPDGRDGVWLELDVARAALAALRSEPDYISEVALLQRRLELRMDEAGALRRAVADVTRARDEIHGALARALAAEARARARADAWYRSPALWAGTGFVLGGLLAVLVAFALHAGGL